MLCVEGVQFWIPADIINVYWITAIVSILTMAVFLIQWQVGTLKQRPYGLQSPKY